MTPKKRRRLQRTVRVALGLAEDLRSRLPACSGFPASVIAAAVWPLAVQLEKLRRQAKRDRKAAGRYRALRAEVDELLRAVPDSPAPLAALANTIPFDTGCWHTALAPGAGVSALEAA